jgi:predicted RNA-binding protein with PIN domain
MTTHDTASSTDPVEAPPVPESLLVPLLDTAAAALARLDPGDVPPVLRPLAGFDRRRLTTSGPARQQLRRAFDVDDDFRAKVVDQLREKPEIEDALRAWSPTSALAQVRDAAERSDLPLLASALYAARPRGWAFGIGMVCAVADQERADKEHTDDVKAAELRAASFDEARRRAETARDVARADAVRLEEELREERAGRRDRDSRARDDVEDADRRRRDAEQASEQARAEANDAQARLAREGERAREAEKELRSLRRELDRHVSEAAAPNESWARPDADALARAVEESRQLTASLEGLTQRAREAAVEEVAAPEVAVPEDGVDASAPATADSAVEPSPRRTRVPCPPGMRAETPEALDAMLRTRGVVLVVDGYNVSMRGWSDALPADQRERLLAALERLHLRVRCDVVVVFDGADVGHVPGPRRTGVRVVFSAEGEEADPVVVREVAARPARVPVIVVSSDGWVRDHAEAEGATVVPSPVLLDVLRR